MLVNGGGGVVIEREQTWRTGSWRRVRAQNAGGNLGLKMAAVNGVEAEPCRLCDNVADKMFNIFDDNPEGYQLIGLIKENLPIVVSCFSTVLAKENNLMICAAVQNGPFEQTGVRKMRFQLANYQQFEKVEPENSGKVRGSTEKPGGHHW